MDVIPIQLSNNVPQVLIHITIVSHLIWSVHRTASHRQIPPLAVPHTAWMYSCTWSSFSYSWWFALKKKSAFIFPPMDMYLVRYASVLFTRMKQILKGTIAWSCRVQWRCANFTRVLRYHPVIIGVISDIYGEWIVRCFWVSCRIQ